MSDDLKLIDLLFKDFIKNAKLYESKAENHWSIYMNKNYGKTAIKRKITTLRNELLNFEKKIDRR